MASEKKEKLPTFTTPKGVAKWPHLVKPDQFGENKPIWKTNLILESADAQAFSAKIAPLAEKAFDDAKKKLLGEKDPQKKKKAAEAAKQLKLHLPFENEVGDDGEETGRVIFKFKRNTEKRDGTKLAPPALFDAKGKPTKANPWGGSVLKISCVATPFHNASANNAGVSLSINAVQIIELVSGGQRDASAYGFGEEEGYEGGDEAPAEEEGSAPSGDAGGDAPDAEDF